MTENEDCNDFDPMNSQQWAMGVTLLDDLPALLTDAVDEYFKLSTKRETVEQLLGRLQSPDGNVTNSNSCDDSMRIASRIIEQRNAHG